MRFEPGDLLLLAFPFADEAVTKKRPALVVLDTGDEDVPVARVITQPHSTPFDVAISDWQGAGLIAPSTIRLHKMATIEKRLVKRKLGRLQEPDRSAVRSAFEIIYCQPPERPVLKQK
jgi:mRNA interferase MazF